MDLGHRPPFYSLSFMLRAAAQYPANRIGPSADETRPLLWTDPCTSPSPPLPPYHGKKNTVCSVSFPHAPHKQWDQTACILVAQPQHQNPELMVSTRTEGLPSLEDGLGTLRCAWLLLKSRVNFPCARLQAEPFTVVGLVTNLSAQQPLQKFSPAAEAGIWFAGSEEERQGAGSLPPILMEQEGTQAVFLGGLGFSAPWIKTTDLPKTKDGKRENSASLQLLERSKEWVS